MVGERRAWFLRQPLGRFGRDQRGGVVVILALSLLPMIGLTGAAVDYSLASARKAKLQAAVDAVAIALAPMTLDSSDDQLLSQARKVFVSVMPDADPTLLRITVSGNRTELTAEASSDYDPRFGSFFGKAKIPVDAKAMSRVSDTTYEIALVLDNSTSMANMAGGRSKVDAAKEAASGLVDTVFATPAMASRTKIAVVPYTSSVHVGAEYRTAPWVDAQGWSKIHWENVTKPAGIASRFELFDGLNEPWGGCFESRPDGMAFTDEAPSSARPDSLFVPMFAPDEPGDKLATAYGAETVRNSYLNDDGEGACAATPLPAEWTPRQQLGCKYNINKDPAKISVPTHWGIRGGPNFMCNAVKLLRMSSSSSTIRAKLQEMRAVGDTSIFEGIAWGWRTLSPSAPFSDGRAYGRPENRKVIILLSDGNNNWLQQNNTNRSLYSPMGFWTNDRLTTGLVDQASANTLLDTRTKDVCQNAKTAGVLIYTVGIKLPGQTLPASWSDLITGCASDVDGRRQAYIAENGDEVIAIFQEIARNILKPRLAS